MEVCCLIRFSRNEFRFAQEQFTWVDDPRKRHLLLVTEVRVAGGFCSIIFRHHLQGAPKVSRLVGVAIRNFGDADSFTGTIDEVALYEFSL